MTAQPTDHGQRYPAARSVRILPQDGVRVGLRCRSDRRSGRRNCPPAPGAAGARQDPQLSDLAVATVRELDATDVPSPPDVGLVEFTGSASTGPAPLRERSTVSFRGAFRCSCSRRSCGSFGRIRAAITCPSRSSAIPREISSRAASVNILHGQLTWYSSLTISPTTYTKINFFGRLGSRSGTVRTVASSARRDSADV